MDIVYVLVLFSGFQSKIPNLLSMCVYVHRFKTLFSHSLCLPVRLNLYMCRLLSKVISDATGSRSSFNVY